VVTLKKRQSPRKQTEAAYGVSGHLRDVALLTNLTFAYVFYGLELVHTLSPLQDIKAMGTNSTQRHFYYSHRFAAVLVRHVGKLVLMRRFLVLFRIASLRGHC
jgi:hypothetical protein